MHSIEKQLSVFAVSRNADDRAAKIAHQLGATLETSESGLSGLVLEVGEAKLALRDYDRPRTRSFFVDSQIQRRVVSSRDLLGRALGQHRLGRLDRIVKPGARRLATRGRDHPVDEGLRVRRGAGRTFRGASEDGPGGVRAASEDAPQQPRPARPRGWRRPSRLGSDAPPRGRVADRLRPPRRTHRHRNLLQRRWGWRWVCGGRPARCGRGTPAAPARLPGGRLVPRGQALLRAHLRALTARAHPQAVPRDGAARPSSPRRAGGSVPADEGQQHRGRHVRSHAERHFQTNPRASGSLIDASLL